MAAPAPSLSASTGDLRQHLRRLEVSLAVDGYRWTPDQRQAVMREIAALNKLRLASNKGPLPSRVR